MFDNLTPHQKAAYIQQRADAATANGDDPHAKEPHVLVERQLIAALSDAFTHEGERR